MSFDRIPSELWKQILHYLGPAFFKEDLKRLTLSKRWSSIALAELRSHVSLTTNNGTVAYLLETVAYLSETVAYLSETNRSSLPDWAGTGIRSLHVQFVAKTICTQGRDYLSEAERAQEPRKRDYILHEALHAAEHMTAWPIIKNLEQLCGLRKLDLCLNVKGSGSFYARPTACEYGVFAALEQVILPLQLRDLKLEIRGNNAFGGNLHHTLSTHHICKVLHSLLVRSINLRSVDLKLDYVCPRLFKSVPEQDRPQAPKLESLVLNCVIEGLCSPGRDMSIECGDRGDRTEGYPSRRRGYGSATAQYQSRIDKLTGRLHDAAGRFAQSLPALKNAHIVWPNAFACRLAIITSAPSRTAPAVLRHVYVQDVLTGDVRATQDKGSWDGIGCAELVDLDIDQARWRDHLDSVLNDCESIATLPAIIPHYETDSDSESAFNSEPGWDFHGGRRDERGSDYDDGEDDYDEEDDNADEWEDDDDGGDGGNDNSGNDDDVDDKFHDDLD